MRLKESVLKQQEKEYERYLGYEEWLRDNMKNLSDKDISQLQQSSNLKLANNHNYQPLQGA